MKQITFYLQTVLLLAVAGLFFLTGCGGATIATGRKFDTTNVKNIKKGVSTKAEILQMLDQPYLKNINAGKETWTYTYRSTVGKRDGASYIPFVGTFVGSRDYQHENSSLSLVFEKDVVKECNFAYGSGSNRATGVMGEANLQTTAPATQVTEPCGD